MKATAAKEKLSKAELEERKGDIENEAVGDVVDEYDKMTKVTLIGKA